MDRLSWPIFGEDKRRLQEEFLSLLETDDIMKRLFETLQDNVRQHAAQDEYCQALEDDYQRMLDELVQLVAPNETLHYALRQYLREWLDSEVYRTCGYPPMTPYGQRQVYLLPDNPATFGPGGATIPLEARKDHRQKIESVFEALEPKQGPGRPRGRKKYFRDRLDFHETIVALMRAALLDGRDPSEDLIAEMFLARRHAKNRHGMNSAETDISPAATKRNFQRCMKDYGYTWEALRVLASIPR